jgi:cell division FtsZ-interacting protein ZapD
MYTKEQVERGLNQQRRRYENILIDIMFNLLDIEERIEDREDIIEEIERLKVKIGKELKD